MKLEFIEIMWNGFNKKGYGPDRIYLSEDVTEIELFIAEPVDQDYGESEVHINRKDGSVQRIFLRRCLYIKYKKISDE